MGPPRRAQGKSGEVMKIALVSPYDFAFPGGVTNHILSLDRYLTKMGHEVRVIAPASKAVPALGDRFIPIGKPRPIPSSGSIIRISVSLHLAPTIKRVLKREKFDIIHLHEPFMPMLCSAVLRFSDTVNIGTFHAWDGKPGYDFGWPISTFMLRRRVRKLHGRIAVSQPAMTFAGKHVPGEFTIIPNGIDLEHFKPDIKPIERFMDGKRNVLFVGRLEHRKGAAYLIHAFEHVLKEVPDSRLIIVGPGTRLRKRYENWVKRKRLDKDIIFIGYVPYDELPRYYKTADVYCSPATSHESFGIVLLEAMAVGTPLVAASIEGYRRVVTDGEDGLLVPPRDSVALSRTLVRLLKDGELRQRLSRNGIVKAQAYSWKKVSQRVLEYYYQVLRERQGAAEPAGEKEAQRNGA